MLIQYAGQLPIEVGGLTPVAHGKRKKEVRLGRFGIGGAQCKHTAHRGQEVRRRTRKKIVSKCNVM